MLTELFSVFGSYFPSHLLQFFKMNSLPSHGINKLISFIFVLDVAEKAWCSICNTWSFGTSLVFSGLR